MSQVKGLQIKEVEGKTVSKVKFSLTWRNNPEEFENLTIEFTDGTKLEINGHSEAGCEYCNEDGSACTYIDIWKTKKEESL